MSAAEAMSAIDEILIAFLGTQAITRARAEELIAKDPNSITELINAQVSEAETALMAASLVPDTT